LAQTESDGKRREVGFLVRERFIEALAAQERHARAREAQGMAQKLLDAVKRRVREGGSSAADEIRAGLALAETEMEIRQSRVRLEAAKKKLALLWGGHSVSALAGNLESHPPLPAWEEVERKAGENPEARSKAEAVKLARARRAQQQSLSRPDMTIRAGLRHDAASGDVALVGGIALPLPLRNRNQGGVRAAESEIILSEAEARAALLEVKSALAEIHAELAVAAEAIRALREDMLPGSEKAARILEEGFRQGRFGMPEVLNAAADLFRLRLRYLEALARYHQGFAALERRIGRADFGKENPASAKETP
jgi:cobalt-zinc-cadmium efflux system outer membrane protein